MDNTKYSAGVATESILDPGGNVWEGVLQSTAFTHFYGAAGCPAAATTGTSTEGVANTIWLTELYIPQVATLTGIAYLIGGTGGTDKAIAMLFNSAGTLLANSAVAGTTVGTNGTWQRLAFTATVTVGPGQYLVGIQTNGTTAYVQTAATGNHITGTNTAQTFGTPANLSAVPSTFTAGDGPWVMVY